MDCQVLVDELTRMKEGLPDAESRVLFALSRSSLFFLAADEVPNDDSSSVVIRLVVEQIGDRATAYLFSSQDALRAWCDKRGFQPHAMPIHGGDVNLLLPKSTWIRLDPETPHSVLLSPDQLSMINQEPSAGMGMIVAPKPDSGFVTPPVAADDTASAPAVYKPLEPELKETQEPPKRKFAPRTHPTTMFAAPNVEKKDLPRRERTYTSSNLRKVIRPPKDGE